MKRRGRGGHAMLELALSAGVMVACLGGTFEFGYTFYTYNRLVTAVGNGGRYAATVSSPQSTEAIQNMVVYGDSRPAPDAVPVVPNLTPANVQVEWVNDHVRVSIENYKVDALFGSFTFTGRPLVEFPYLGGQVP